MTTSKSFNILESNLIFFNKKKDFQKYLGSPTTSPLICALVLWAHVLKLALEEKIVRTKVLKQYYKFA